MAKPRITLTTPFVIILSLKIHPHVKCVATLPCEMSSVLEATIENKTISVVSALLLEWVKIESSNFVHGLALKVPVS